MGNDCFILFFFRTSDFSPLLVRVSRPFQSSKTSNKSEKQHLYYSEYKNIFLKSNFFRVMNIHRSHESVFGERVLQLSEVATSIAAAVAPR